MSDDSDGQRQCRRGVTVDVELGAAMALADMAGVAGPGGEQPPPVRRATPAPSAHQVNDYNRRRRHRRSALLALLRFNRNS
jgi:hypothetical protein